MPPRKATQPTQPAREAPLNWVQSAPDFTASVRPVAPGLVVSNETLIPPDYWVPQPPKLNRQELISILKSGTTVPGAGLSNGGSTLSVRVR